MCVGSWVFFTVTVILLFDQYLVFVEQRVNSPDSIMIVAKRKILFGAVQCLC